MEQTPLQNLFFNTSGNDANSGGDEQLVKALSAGYGTDSAMYRDGRAFITEDCEITMASAMKIDPEDCKI